MADCMFSCVICDSQTLFHFGFTARAAGGGGYRGRVDGGTQPLAVSGFVSRQETERIQDASGTDFSYSVLRSIVISNREAWRRASCCARRGGTRTTPGSSRTGSGPSRTGISCWPCRDVHFRHARQHAEHGHFGQAQVQSSDLGTIFLFPNRYLTANLRCLFVWAPLTISDYDGRRLEDCGGRTRSVIDACYECV